MKSRSFFTRQSLNEKAPLKLALNPGGSLSQGQESRISGPRDTLRTDGRVTIQCASDLSITGYVETTAPDGSAI